MLTMASSSSLSRSWLYHVFLSFRGEDVRKGFLSHVRKGLESKGIIAFVDDEMKRGESVGPMLVGAITQSRLAIVIFSRNYASSSWCLDELVEIMKGMKENQQKVIPIFYEVDPSHVRKQTGYFGEVFDETCVGKTEEEKKAWRQALKDVAGIAGYASSDWDNEAEMIDKVASNVTDVLGFKPSKDFDDFVGIGAHITEIKSKFILQSEEVKVIVLVGPAGIGKTTIARVLYNQLSPGFPFNTFLENIRGSYEKPCGNEYPFKLRLHQHLLSQLLKRSDIEVLHLGVAQEMLCDKKVLVVLDEVDSWWQLEEMAKQHGWVGPGSIIIITTEDIKLFKQLRLGMDYIYKMKFPTDDESVEIFCQYAFGQKSPEKGFEEFAWEVTELAGKLPLGLRVMGSYLRGMSREEWIEALPRLRSSLDREIDATLRFSFDGLSDKDKAIFLHIACFFAGFKLYSSMVDSKVDSFKSLLEKSGLEVNHGLQVLADKSLISINNYGYINMHSLLQKMGREIVKKKSLEEPGKSKFLWDNKDISEVLEESTGTGTVLSILLNDDSWERKEEIHISKSAFDGMKNLQFLRVESKYVHIPEGLNCFPNKLRLIYWENCPMRFWPSKFSGKFLVELIVRYSKFEKLWEGILPLQCLKLMDLSHSTYLKEIPDLSNATSLEKLDLRGCSYSLLELPSSIGNATKLRVCKLRGCWDLKELPSSIGRLINLEVLDLTCCWSLKKFSGFSSLEKLSGCSSLKKLNLHDTGIEEMPLSVSTFSCLYKLDMSRCGNLKEFPNVSDSIVELVLSETGIKEIPPWIEKLFRLRKLTMYECTNLQKISPNISKLENLEFLALSFCEYIEEPGWEFYTELFEATIKWGPDFKRCWRLETDYNFHHTLSICLPDKVRTSPVSVILVAAHFENIPDCIRSLSGLSKLEMLNCRKLVALPQLPGSLQSIRAKDCESLKRIDSSFQNPNIGLNFTGCDNLNQEARKLLQTSACKYAILPGEEVPAHFPHQSTSDSLTINLTPKPLPSAVRFKACILVSYNTAGLQYNEVDYTLRDVSCCVRGKQNGLTIEYRSTKRSIRYICDHEFFPRHLYIFEDSFCLNQDCPEVEETPFSELSFVFIVHDAIGKVKGCGVRLLEIPHCSLDGNEDDDK